jgi:hypothetical protein
MKTVNEPGSLLTVELKYRLPLETVQEICAASRRRANQGFHLGASRLGDNEKKIHPPNELGF